MPGSLSILKLAGFRPLFAAFALLFVLASPAAAQLSFKPTAEAVQEDKLLNALKEGDKITGRVSIPDGMSASLIQPAGRDWRDFQRSKLPWIGGIAILGMLALLAIFLMVRDLGLLDNPLGVALPQAAFGLPMTIIILRPFFRSIPRELEDAARIDGCGTFGFFWRVLLPPGRPAVVTLMLLLFMWTWNEFLLALVMIQSDELRTAPLGLAFFVGNRSTDYVSLAAGAVIVAIPVVAVYLALQRDFIRGMFTGALRG